MRIRDPRHERFVRWIDQLINASSKTQRQMADEMGYEKSNIISMFKSGITRVPLAKRTRSTWSVAPW